MPIGRTVSIESLSNKTLAVDVSIWLVQFLKAMRDPETGEMIPSAHLLGSLRRIMKLMFHNIRPILVFDGQPPAVKLREIRRRKKLSQNADEDVKKTARKILVNQLRERELLARERRINKQGEVAVMESERLDEQIEDAAAADRNAGGFLYGGDAYEDGKVVVTEQEAPTTEQQEAGGFFHDEDANDESDGSGDVSFVTNPNPDNKNKNKNKNEKKQSELDAYVDSEASSDADSFINWENAEDDDNNQGDIRRNLTAGDAYVPSSGALDLDVAFSLPSSIRADVIEKAKANMRVQSRKEYMPVASNPTDFSGVQIASFLRASKLNHRIMEAGKRNVEREKRRKNGDAIDFKLGDDDDDDDDDDDGEDDDEFGFEGVGIGLKHGGRKRKASSAVKTSGKVRRKISDESDDDENPMLYDSEASDDVSDDIDASGGKGANIIKVMNKELIENDERLAKSLQRQEFGDAYSSTTAAFEQPMNENMLRRHENKSFDDTDNLLREWNSDEEDSSSSEDLAKRRFAKKKDPAARPLTFDDLKPTSLKVDNMKTLADVQKTSSRLTSWAGRVVKRNIREYIASKEEEDDGDHHEREERDFQAAIDASLNRSDSPIPTDEDPDADEDDDDDSDEDGYEKDEREVQAAISASINRSKKPATEYIMSPLLSADESNNEMAGMSSKPASTAVGTTPFGDIVGLDKNRSTFYDSESESDGIINDEIVTMDSQLPPSSVEQIHESDKAASIAASVNSSSAAELDEDDPPRSNFGNDNQGIDGEVQSENKKPPDSALYTPSSLASSTKAKCDAKANDENKKITLTSDHYDGDDEVVVGGEENDFNDGVNNDNNDDGDDGNSDSGYEDDNYEQKMNSHREKMLAMKQKQEMVKREREMFENLSENLATIQENQRKLRASLNKQQRDSDHVTKEMTQELIEMLELFGLPYVLAPGEAEAQCAELERLGLVDGVVTSDSDIFVFGGRNVYKNMFENLKSVEAYFAKDAEKEMKIKQDDFVTLAMLLGGDYSAGVKGVGIVNAMEILSAFPGAGNRTLEEFKTWLGGFDPMELVKKDTKVTENMSAREIFHQQHKSLRHSWQAPAQFPARDALEAYRQPNVDSSEKRFTWGDIDVDGLKRFCSKFVVDFDEMFDPFLKQIRENKRKKQQTLETYFTRYEDDRRFASVRSKRLQTAIKDVSGIVPGLKGDDDEQGVSKTQEGVVAEASSATKTGKGGGVARKVKNARSAFSFFSAEMHKKLSDSNPEITFAERSKTISKKWKSIAPEDLDIYTTMAEEDRSRYRKEKSAEVVYEN